MRTESVAAPAAVGFPTNGPTARGQEVVETELPEPDLCALLLDDLTRETPGVGTDAVGGVPAGAPAATAAPDHAHATTLTGAGMTKIVVAIHGIGQQLRSDTIRAVARRFGDAAETPIPLLPLGYFSIGNGSDVRWSQLDTHDRALSTIGFAEVFWADIPNELVKSNDTLEETKAWAKTVVSRAEGIYQDQVKDERRTGAKLAHVDFQHGIEAIDTIVEGIAVIERLSKLVERAGVFKFEVGKLLRDYAGDVQTVTEFPQHRDQILYRFHEALNGIVTCFQKHYERAPEIYLVAHSEGTVIGLLAQLQALSSMEVPDPAGQGPVQHGAWITSVRGFMTLGSPIDKHIALWPKLWGKFQFVSKVSEHGVTICNANNPQACVTLPEQIKWRNYFDYGDPVGFRLDAAVGKLKDMGCKAFEFDTKEHDHGFSRYWLPGKAHVDYWKDAQLFRHFIDSVVLRSNIRAAPPPSKPLCHIFAKWLPYLLAFALHVAALLVLFKALPVTVGANLSFYDRGAGALVLGVLLAALTLGSRLPRIVRPELRWFVLSGVGFGLAGLALLILPGPIATGVDNAWSFLTLPWFQPSTGSGKWALLAATAASAAAAWIFPRRGFLSGRWVLIACGLLACSALVLSGGNDSPALTVKQAGAYLAVAGLWWLGIILFELAFIWHRYIRQSVCVRTLRAWQRKRDSDPDMWWGLRKNSVQREIDDHHCARERAVAGNDGTRPPDGAVERTTYAEAPQP